MLDVTSHLPSNSCTAVYHNRCLRVIGIALTLVYSLYEFQEWSWTLRDTKIWPRDVPEMCERTNVVTLITRQHETRDNHVISKVLLRTSDIECAILDAVVQFRPISVSTDVVPTLTGYTNEFLLFTFGLAAFNTASQHDDTLNVLFPNHLPKMRHRLRQGTLRVGNVSA